MTVANLEVYDALIDVGVAPEKARRAAEAVGASAEPSVSQEGRFGRIEADIAGLKADVATLKVDVAALKVDVAALKVDVAALKVEVATLRGEVANLKWIVLFHGALTLVVLGKLFALI